MQLDWIAFAILQHDRGFSLRGLVANGRLLPLHVPEWDGLVVTVERLAVKVNVRCQCKPRWGWDGCKAYRSLLPEMPDTLHLVSELRLNFSSGV